MQTTTIMEIKSYGKNRLLIFCSNDSIQIIYGNFQIVDSSFNSLVEYIAVTLSRNPVVAVLMTHKDSISFFCYSY